MCPTKILVVTSIILARVSPLLPLLVGVFCTSKIHGGQDHVFLFRDGLVNYKAHYSLSWFMPLFGGNSPTSSGLILKMNSGYNDVRECLRSSLSEKEKCCCIPPT
jgi:hypothetical protein